MGKKITGDRWRRLKVQIEPLLHVEAQKAIERMRRGSNLLKHTHYGFPHLRQFQLSDDKKRLVWYSGAKRKEDSVVQLDLRRSSSRPCCRHPRRLSGKCFDASPSTTKAFPDVLRFLKET